MATKLKPFKAITLNVWEEGPDNWQWTIRRIGHLQMKGEAITRQEAISFMYSELAGILQAEIGIP